MIGFALILVIVTILIFVFMSVSKDKGDDAEINDYEPNSFIQALLFHTTGCQSGSGVDMYATIEKAMRYCVEDKKCINDVDPCEELESELTQIMDISWNVGEDLKDKGYSLSLVYGDDELYNFTEGITTANSMYAIQKFEGDRLIEFVLYR
jgi:hypothetical protein